MSFENKTTALEYSALALDFHVFHTFTYISKNWTHQIRYYSNIFGLIFLLFDRRPFFISASIIFCLILSSLLTTPLKQGIFHNDDCKLRKHYFAFTLNFKKIFWKWLIKTQKCTHFHLPKCYRHSIIYKFMHC